MALGLPSTAQSSRRSAGRWSTATSCVLWACSSFEAQVYSDYGRRPRRAAPAHGREGLRAARRRFVATNVARLGSVAAVFVAFVSFGLLATPDRSALGGERGARRLVAPPLGQRQRHRCGAPPPRADARTGDRLRRQDRRVQASAGPRRRNIRPVTVAVQVGAEERLAAASAVADRFLREHRDGRARQERGDPARADGARLRRPRAPRGRSRYSEDGARPRDRAVDRRRQAARIQCTPDLQPTDVTGLSVYNQKTRDFEFRPGPIFANVVLVDEINRAMPKTQSALLEAMAERQVTVDGVTRPLPRPFLLLATENPIEYEGTFPLPEAQLDRFFLQTALGYPSARTSCGSSTTSARPSARRSICSRSSPSRRSQRSTAPSATSTWTRSSARWIVGLVQATREIAERSPSAPRCAAASRSSGQLRAWALLRPGLRRPDDVEHLFMPVLGHRVVFAPRKLAGARQHRLGRGTGGLQAASLERSPPPDGERHESDPVTATLRGRADAESSGCGRASGAASRFPSSRGTGSSASRSERCTARAGGSGRTSPARARTGPATTRRHRLGGLGAALRGARP